jgi:hypothetical protein
MSAAVETIGLEPLAKMALDLRKSASTMGPKQARYLVDAYYTTQDFRIRAAGQARAAAEDEEPHALLTWTFDAYELIEIQIRKALHEFAKSEKPGEWALSIHGIGPVIAAGLLAHIDVNPWRCMNVKAKKKCRQDAACSAACGFHPVHTAGGVWRFAGLDPTAKWEKGKKRPWNADLKVLCWKIGESFARLRNSPNDIYGKVYDERKALEVAKNERGDFSELAAETLALKKFGDNDTRKCYEDGKLPPGRLDLRAKRYAVKLFLSHYHHVAYETKFGTPPPKPYVIEHMGHAHYIKPPNWE